MNHFYLQIIADKKIKRQVSLLQRIHDADYAITLEEISEEFHVSQKTLERDIRELEQAFPERDFFSISKVQGYRINDKLAIDDLLMVVSKQSPLFQIISNVYEEIFLSIDEWADELFLSTSTLYRYLQHLRALLAEFKLTLTTNPVDIQGKEENIRYFYYYFSITLMICPWNIAQDKSNMISLKKNYLFFMKEVGYDVYIQHRSILYWIKVISHRIEQGHFVKIDEAFKAEQMKTPRYHYVHQLARETLDPELDNAMPEDEVIYIDLLLLENYLYKERDEIVMQRLYESKSWHEGLREFVELFFSDSKIEKPDESSLSIFMFYLENVLLLSRLTPLFQRNFYEINQFVKLNHPILYEHWLNELVTSDIPEIKSLEYKEDVAVNLAMFTYYVTHQSYQAKKHILFALDGKKAYMNYMQVFVNEFISKHSKVTFISNKRVTNELIHELGVDMLVQNYRDETVITECLQYRTSRLPNMHDWERINSLLLNL
ncbi:mga helix-turn-helix domain-containing protein [Listeria weihenstephanensis FSL R9-0317]|uniref:helix-turn-helix domain-containing protein n=1 Tax=Listeria weihenstephanensis TaxID=1006155 RepID=UPI0003E880AA|nr:helix-turn-helix domain-containing protein [Listeria weihenstephanensis]EUJ35019.1 mga helix-turn-helix domain-containing protein [Listeria weihenstephanensis FSL R9-0317]